MAQNESVNIKTESVSVF